MAYDTLSMNVAIGRLVDDLDTRFTGVPSAIALRAQEQDHAEFMNRSSIPSCALIF
jgi:hypothetical protein